MNEAANNTDAEAAAGRSISRPPKACSRPLREPPCSDRSLACASMPRRSNSSTLRLHPDHSLRAAKTYEQMSVVRRRRHSCNASSGSRTLSCREPAQCRRQTIRRWQAVAADVAAADTVADRFVRDNGGIAP